MTWSILVREPDGRFGVAIASRFFSVGSLCIHTRAGSGAIATQALMNPLYGPQGLAAHATGVGLGRRRRRQARLPPPQPRGPAPKAPALAGHTKGSSRLGLQLPQ
ncbi:MAG: DUF1028 domain-containing protein, partial [Betaproteobacteria bacterium]|nr:DUF1028 domain-containing protein [Betaproteobacteria bacterium]